LITRAVDAEDNGVKTNTVDVLKRNVAVQCVGQVKEIAVHVLGSNKCGLTIKVVL
tara:strand:- start:5445 stop:5609 length:165 start_codon:yes stop_codon:yes gene_type:complete